MFVKLTLSNTADRLLVIWVVHCVLYASPSLKYDILQGVLLSTLNTNNLSTCVERLLVLCTLLQGGQCRLCNHLRNLVCVVLQVEFLFGCAMVFI